jgi:predicted nucleic acid-binding protein
VPLDSAVLARATDFAWDLKLRGADAIHLGAVHVLHESLAARSVSLVLVTADLELLAAAQRYQISVVNPMTASG